MIPPVIPIPIRHSARTRRFPFVNLLIVLACTAVFVAVRYLIHYSGATSNEIEDTLDRYALIPARMVALAQRGCCGSLEPYLPLVSSAFLHVSILHFVPNMIFLWVLGDGIEDRFGHLGYAALYVLGALFASLAHVAAHPSSTVPTLGASGGIATIMGAYLLLYPREWIDLRLAPFPWPGLRLPAVLVLLGWLTIQILAGIVHLPALDRAGVAWWAHLGGFTFGAAAVIALGHTAKRRARAR
jgi:membrane associated rhomboid family serine protease